MKGDYTGISFESVQDQAQESKNMEKIANEHKITIGRKASLSERIAIGSKTKVNVVVEPADKKDDQEHHIDRDESQIALDLLLSFEGQNSDNKAYAQAPLTSNNQVDNSSTDKKGTPMDCDKGKNDLIDEDEDHMSLEENSKVSTSNGSAKWHTPDRFAKSQLAFDQVTIPKKRKYVRKKPTEKTKLSYADYMDTNNFALDITKKPKGLGAYDFCSYTLKTTNKKQLYLMWIK